MSIQNKFCRGERDRGPQHLPPPSNSGDRQVIPLLQIGQCNRRVPRTLKPMPSLPPCHGSSLGKALAPSSAQSSPAGAQPAQREGKGEPRPARTPGRSAGWPGRKSSKTPRLFFLLQVRLLNRKMLKPSTRSGNSTPPHTHSSAGSSQPRCTAPLPTACQISQPPPQPTPL